MKCKPTSFSEPRPISIEDIDSSTSGVVVAALPDGTVLLMNVINGESHVIAPLWPERALVSEAAKARANGAS